MKLKAIDYKGKYFVLQDEAIEEDFVIDYVDTEHIVNNEEALREHVSTCNYYGIPAYLGGDVDLHERINEIESAINKH